MIAPLLLAVAFAQTPTAQQVMDRVHKAYDSVKTLEVDVTGGIGKTKGTAHISYQRPGKLRVAGQTLFHSRYDLLSTGTATWVNSNGGWEKSDSVDMGIASITGISANTGTHIPALLMHSQWGMIFQPVPKDLKVKAVVLDGHPAYLLQSTTPINQSIWVDAGTYFLVKSESKPMDQTLGVKFGPHKVNKPIPASRFVK